MGTPKQPSYYASQRARFPRALIAVIVLVVSFLLSCTNNSPDLPKIEGSWKSSYNDISVVETWRKKGNTLVGTTIWEQDTNRRVDHLEIVCKKDTLVYSLKMEGEPVIHFYCNNIFSDTLIFLNEQNEFPKRIVYVRPKGRKMNVWIDNGDNDLNRMSFGFEKIHNE